MSPLPLIAEVPVDSLEFAERPVPDSAFEARWAAWQAQGRKQESAFRRRVYLTAPVVVVAAAAAYVLLIR